jgi:hypothetical protein
LRLIPGAWVQEIRSMMGERRVVQEALFYGLSLERHVPDGHLLREIDRFVDLTERRAPDRPPRVLPLIQTIRAA